MTIVAAAGVCAAAYGFLSTYALKTLQQEQLTVQQGQLRRVQQQHRELMRKQAVLKQAAQFSQLARDLGLQPADWSFYDVSIQAPMPFEAAQEIIRQCDESGAAYFWPISLEVKAQDNNGEKTAARPADAVAADVQLTVKGRFVANR